MPDYGHDLRFGVFIPPAADQAAAVLDLAQLADALGLDYVTFQDHPYQPRFLDTWTLLSVVAAQTANIRVAPNVANLPLRQPVVLARSVATLDLTTGGRVDLGLGAGAFYDAVASIGGPRLTPKASVDALEEGIDVIRAAWGANGDPISYEGEHYRIDGAHPGPMPGHPVEIWLGAYKPRMLRLTGAKADGWVPSMGYIELDELGPANARIDEAAAAAGRRGAEIRRLLNITEDLGPERLAELTLTTGMSAYILAVSSADDIRRFAEETAPAARELVETERGRDGSEPEPAPVPVGGREAPLAARPTPDDGTRRASEAAWDEATRPAGPAADPDRAYTPDQQAAGQHLIDVHDALRAELERLRDLVEQVGRGTADPATVRSFINRMTIRQNNWTLGVFCETYCRVVTQHHTLEDRSVFPHLRRSEPGLVPVLDRLAEEHETIADLLERVDGALVELVKADQDGIDGVRATVDLLGDALLSHFSYEERELVEPLARHGFY
jgi:alkanesulfonate monooxygenase SsuD/methylene tetrahydromethanopterin reductase-like flavin-dependent oxidoreductase (luciferase family)